MVSYFIVCVGIFSSELLLVLRKLSVVLDKDVFLQGECVFISARCLGALLAWDYIGLQSCLDLVSFVYYIRNVNLGH